MVGCSKHQTGDGVYVAQGDLPSASHYLVLSSPQGSSAGIKNTVCLTAFLLSSRMVPFGEHAALTQEPQTKAVIDELRVLHPRPCPQDAALLSSLRNIGPAVVPSSRRPLGQGFHTRSCGWPQVISSWASWRRLCRFFGKALFLLSLSYGFVGRRSWPLKKLRVPCGLSRSEKPSAGILGKSQ